MASHLTYWLRHNISRNYPTCCKNILTSLTKVKHLQQWKVHPIQNVYMHLSALSKEKSTTGKIDLRHKWFTIGIDINNLTADYNGFLYLLECSRLCACLWHSITIWFLVVNLLAFDMNRISYRIM